MNYGAHLSTLIAVIVGLAVTELLAGASRTLLLKRSKGFSWLPFAQAIMIGTITLIFWIASYAELSSGKYLGIFAFATQLGAAALLYFAATRVFPQTHGEQSATVHAHCVANARDVYFPPALWMVCTVAGNIYYFWPNWRATLGPNALCATAVVSLLIAAGTHRDLLRWAATICTEAIILVFVLMYLTIPS
jgi:hypothetical protein